MESDFFFIFMEHITVGSHHRNPQHMHDIIGNAQACQRPYRPGRNMQHQLGVGAGVKRIERSKCRHLACHWIIPHVSNSCGTAATRWLGPRSWLPALDTKYSYLCLRLQFLRLASSRLRHATEASHASHAKYLQWAQCGNLDISVLSLMKCIQMQKVIMCCCMYTSTQSHDVGRDTQCPLSWYFTCSKSLMCHCE